MYAKFSTLGAILLEMGSHLWNQWLRRLKLRPNIVSIALFGIPKGELNINVAEKAAVGCCLAILKTARDSQRG